MTIGSRVNGRPASRGALVGQGHPRCRVPTPASIRFAWSPRTRAAVIEVTSDV